MNTLIALLLVLLNLTALCSVTTSSIDEINGTIVVPDDYSKIQDAVDNASSGDTVFVRSGTYEECVSINKTLTLIGEDKTRTIISGEWQLGGTVVLVCHDDVNIKGFTIQNIANNTHGNSIRGVHLLHVRGCTITDCNFTRVGVAVWLYESSDNIIEDNLIDGRPTTVITASRRLIGCLLGGFVGIALQGSSNNTILHNTVVDTFVCAIELSKSNGNNITGNYVKSQWKGVAVTYSDSNIIEHNSITGSRFGLIQDTSSYTIIKNNTIPNSLTGIQINNSSLYNLIEKNTITHSNYCGIELHYNARNNRIVGNSIKDNKHGLEVKASTNNRIIYNNITGNSKIGAIFVDSTENIVQKNNFIKNTQHVSNSEANNIWDADNKGNYWDNYKGTDANNDGVGDSQYVIDESNTDKHPLMKKSETIDITILSPLPQTFNESRVDLNFTLNKAVNWTAYSLDGMDNVTFAGNLTLMGLANGLHNITLYANDGADDIYASEPLFLNILVPEKYFPAPVAVASIILIGTLSGLVCIGIFLNFRKHKRQRTQQHQQR